MKGEMPPNAESDVRKEMVSHQSELATPYGPLTILELDHTCVCEYWQKDWFPMVSPTRTSNVSSKAKSIMFIHIVSTIA